MHNLSVAPAIRMQEGINVFEVIKPFISLGGRRIFSIRGALWSLAQMSTGASRLHIPTSADWHRLIYRPLDSSALSHHAASFLPTPPAFHSGMADAHTTGLAKISASAPTHLTPVASFSSGRGADDVDDGDVFFEEEHISKLSDLPYGLRYYPELTTRWERVELTVRILYDLSNIKTVNLNLMGEIWNHFNRYVFVHYIDFQDEPWVLGSLDFHKRVIRDLYGDRLEDFYDRMARHHMQIRRHFKWPRERVTRADDVTIVDLAKLSADVDRHISIVERADEKHLKEAVLEGVVLLDAAVGSQSAMTRRSVGPVSQAEISRGLFLRENDFVKAAAQLLRARYWFVHEHGSMQKALPNVRLSLKKGPAPAIHYLNAIMRNLGITRANFLKATDIPKSQVINALVKRDCFCPPESVQRILNALGITDASGIGYLLFKEFIDPYFDVNIYGKGVTLTLREPVHRMSLLRTYGLGGLARAHRLVSGKRHHNLIDEPSFPIGSSKSLIYLEHNRGALPKLGPYLQLIDYYGIGAEGILALFPSLPQMIPIHQPDGTLFEDPQGGDFELSTYSPEEYVGMGRRSYGVAVYKDVSPPGTIGHLIAFERALRGWQRADLADMADVGETTITALETGRSTATLETRHKLAEAFGMRIEFIPE